MLTRDQLTDAGEQLARLLALVDDGTLLATGIERAYVVGSRDTLAAVLGIQNEQETAT